MKKILTLISICFAFHASLAAAASVYVTAPESTTEGTQFSARIQVDTDGTSVNSFDITVAYPSNLLAWKGYKEENTIKHIWLVKPTLENGAIHMSGIIPGGADGLYDPSKNALQPLPLAELLFTGSQSGEANLTITHSDILENNGLGSPFFHDVGNASVTIVSRDPSTKPEQITDAIAPDEFTIHYIPAGFFSETPSMVVFSTTDKGSGVERYELKKGADSWVSVSSPLVVGKNLFKKAILIRAVDFDGNAREAKIEIPGLLSTIGFLAILVGVALIIGLVSVIRRKR